MFKAKESILSNNNSKMITKIPTIINKPIMNNFNPKESLNNFFTELSKRATVKTPSIHASNCPITKIGAILPILTALNFHLNSPLNH